MRMSIIAATATLALVACDDATPTQKTPSTIVAQLDPERPAQADACFAVDIVRDDTQEVVAHDPHLCVYIGHPATLAVLCEPGQGYHVNATTLTLGIEATLEDPCAPGGCSVAAVCAADGPVTVEPVSPIVAKQHRGFIDLAINTSPPQPLDDACYRVDITDAHGESQLNHLFVCASDYGVAETGSLTLVTSCNGLAPTHTVTITVDYNFEGSAPTGYAYPCPDGCVETVDCVEGADRLVTFDL